MLWTKFEGAIDALTDPALGGGGNVDDTDYVELTNLLSATSNVANGTKSLTLNLGTDGISSTTNPATWQTVWEGEGNYLALDIYSEERPADYNNIRVPNGVYTFNINNDGMAGTFLESFSIYKEYDSTGMEVAEHPYQEGVLTVTDDLVKLEIKFEDEENLYVVTYSGDYTMQDRRSEAGGIY